MKTKPIPPISEQLRAIIRQSGYNESELARLLGCDKSAINRFLRGERGLSFALLDRLGERFGLEVIVRKER